MMSKLGRILGVLALVLGLSVMGLAQTKHLTILHANDTHSALLPFGHPSMPGPFAWLVDHGGPGSRGRAALVREVGGIARMATLIKRARKRDRTSWPSMPATSSSAASNSTSTWAIPS